jgi:hypothetical protein
MRHDGAGSSSRVDVRAVESAREPAASRADSARQASINSRTAAAMVARLLSRSLGTVAKGGRVDDRIMARNFSSVQCTRQGASQIPASRQPC